MPPPENERSLSQAMGPQSKFRTNSHFPQAKSGAEHPFRSLISGFASALSKDVVSSNFSRRVWYENPGIGDIHGLSNDADYHFRGRMQLRQVEALLPLHRKDAMYYFCGPEPWMRSIAQQLLELHVPKESLAFEVFGPTSQILTESDRPP